jgi:hypothetical protein
MRNDFKFVNKQYLLEQARNILLNGPLSPEVIDRFLAQGWIEDPDIVVQVSSGSTGNPLLIPRTRSDIYDIGRRVYAPFMEKTGNMPERIALIGGISHSQAAMKMNLDTIRIRSFQPDEIVDLPDFDPMVISCYPSVARELLRDLPAKMPSLAAIKLGGEKFFDVDLDKIFRRFPGILIIEQFGSTEVPAIALRVLEENKRSPYLLQKQRFSFHLEKKEGWQPLYVRDDFEDLLFPVREFYETGDEVRLAGSDVVEIRRMGNADCAYFEAAEQLLACKGCVNVQFHPLEKRAVYDGDGGAVPEKITVNGDEYTTEAGKPARIHPSNKMPLIAPQNG